MEHWQERRWSWNTKFEKTFNDEQVNEIYDIMDLDVGHITDMIFTMFDKYDLLNLWSTPGHSRELIKLYT